MNKKILKVIGVLFLILVPIILPLAILDLLLFGNPQWHKTIYMAQRTGLWGMWESPAPQRPEDYSGIWIDWHKNGVKQFECEYENGKEKGKQITWHDNGVKRSEGEFVNGKKVGIHIYWHYNGQKMMEGEFQDGMPIGKHYSWYQNGNPYDVENYNKNGKQHGMQIHYRRDDGVLSEKHEYDQGKWLYEINYLSRDYYGSIEEQLRKYGRLKTQLIPENYKGKVTIELPSELEKLMGVSKNKGFKIDE